MESSYIKSGTENERSKHKNPRVISDISVKIKFDNNKKVWIVENKQDSLINKNDMEIKQAIKQRNTNVIDFKKNIGLVGLTVKKKYMVRGEDITPNLKKSSIEKSRSIKNKNLSNAAKYKLRRKNNKGSGTRPKSQSKYKIGPNKCRNEINVNTKFIKEDSNTQSLDLTCGKEIKHTDGSDQSFTNSMKNNLNPLLPQKDLSSKNKPQTLPSTRRTTYRPGPKCKKAIQEQPGVKTDTEKALDKALEAHDTVPSMEMCTNKSKPNSNALAKSKINVVKSSWNEEKSTNGSFALSNSNSEQKDRSTSYNKNNDQIRSQLPDHRLSDKIGTLKNGTMNSHSSNSLTSINTQSILTKVQNSINKVAEVEIEKTIVKGNSKRSCNTDNITNNTVNKESKTVTKKMKLEKIPNLEAEELNQKKQEESSSGYSPPILPIPSYKTILSLLRAREMISVKTKYWRINDEDTDTPKYMDTQCNFVKNDTNIENHGPQKIKHVTNMESERQHKIKHKTITGNERQHKIGHDTETENVFNNNNEGKVKKISFEEYKRRAPVK